MKRKASSCVRRIIAICLILAGITAMIPAVGAISSGFFQTHTDWHFDLTIEPDRPMTVEEFIALSTAYSWWATGTNSGTTPRDKDGDLPSDWAAPYIRSEAQKGTIQPAQLDYSAPATLAFAMEFFLHCKGRYSFNAVNFYKFTGTEGLTTDQLLCLNAAIDYGIFPYQENMDVSVTLLRRDLENKYLIPTGTLQVTQPTIMESQNYHKSMGFFTDCYYDYDKAAAQVAALKAHKDDFNMVSLGAIYLQKVTDNQQSYVCDRIDHNRPGKTDPQLELISFCKQNNIQILGGVIAYYNDSILKLLAKDDTAMNQAVEELMAVVDRYDLDGLNLDIELMGTTYRSTYSKLLALLAERLHAKGKTLVATVGCYFTDASEQQGIYDYRDIDKYADLVMLIAYDDHSARAYQNYEVTVGDVSNLTYIGRCVRYAKMIFGADKLLLGTASYGVRFNTTDHTAEIITQAEIDALLARTHATVMTSSADVDDAYFTYTENGKSYTVYFESLDGLKRRVDLAKQYGLAGVANFHLATDYEQAFDLFGKSLTQLPFRDVVCGSWYYAGVEYAATNNLFNGMTNTTFEPNTPMNRAMLVTVLWRYAGQPVQGSNQFADVENGKWYTKAIAWASANGIVNGISAGKFDPMGMVTREQLATILFRYCGSKGIDTSARADLSSFPDVDNVSSYAKKAVSWAVAEGIIGGNKINGVTCIDPKGNATRAQVATIMMRFIENVVK